LIFIDPSYLLAIVNKKDQWHNNALKLVPKVENSERVISNILIAETLMD